VAEIEPAGEEDASRTEEEAEIAMYASYREIFPAGTSIFELFLSRWMEAVPQLTLLGKASTAVGAAGNAGGGASASASATSAATGSPSGTRPSATQWAQPLAMTRRLSGLVFYLTPTTTTTAGTIPLYHRITGLEPCAY
jgi:hypothetical protein